MHFDPQYFQSSGIIHETTLHILYGRMRMLSYSSLKGNALLTTYYVLNRVPNKRKKTTLYELWFKTTPNLSYRAVVKLTESKRNTFRERRSIYNPKVPQEVRKSNMVELLKLLVPTSKLYLVEGTRDEVRLQCSYCYNIEEGPKSFKETMES
ncbi:hypothetical protein OSB04_005079 [Centaurea solstitialis]|uniref:Uncharacterized protein n=1 Tax=Centaurea solstitialis TaxID=347529 RepID=A0AA38TFB2_9ASTR|nr:hypothetical protein OSB04_005079 [Centaurea solstitialis]